MITWKTTFVSGKPAFEGRVKGTFLFFVSKAPVHRFYKMGSWLLEPKASSLVEKLPPFESRGLMEVSSEEEAKDLAEQVLEVYWKYIKPC